jgi:hypothetical protein
VVRKSFLGQENSLVIESAWQQDIGIRTADSDKNEVIERIVCWGPGPNFTIEIDGTPTFNGFSPRDDYVAIFGEGAGVNVRGGLRLDTDVMKWGLYQVSLGRAKPTDSR